jgi:threonine aldolase
VSVTTIDLRSDTVTKPTATMRQAMASAEVGDDVYGEDPTVCALERHVAELLGKEAALFVPSGTMGNQLAILSHTRPGDEVYAGEGAHCAWYESGAAGALSGVQIVEVGRGGIFTARDLEAAIKPRAYWCPNPRLVVIENTHNRGGGKVTPHEITRDVAVLARSQGLGLHLDGARLWNAAVASGLTERELADPFDTISVCFSKGLGAPVGSAFVSTAERVATARRHRKMLGGGMRQVGVLAAAARYAIDHHRARLAEDHASARRFAAIVRESGKARVEEPETNVVMVDLDVDAGRVVTALGARGVLLSAFGPHRLRVVTHLDVGLAEVEAAAQAVLEVLEK